MQWTCQVVSIDKTCNKTDLISSRDLWLELAEEAGPWSEVIESGHVGVEYAGQENHYSFDVPTSAPCTNSEDEHVM